MKILPSEGVENFAKNKFFIGLWESDGEWSWLFEPFSKLKTAFCKHWTLTEIKINMTWMYKKDKVKIKIVQQQ